MRAALANLDKRTTSLKKAAKAFTKAAQDVRASLCQLHTSEVSLTESLEAASHLVPSTLGYLHSQLLQRKQKVVDKSRQEQVDVLQHHVEAPLLFLIERCKFVQDQSKSFEQESRLYYAGTQKWLASRSSAPSNGLPKEADNVYSSAAVGYDKATSRQERSDDKQRLRQARFHLARLDMFRAISQLHGGEAEVQLAGHFLTLCRSQCHDKESKELLQGFGKALLVEHSKIQQRGEETQRKYNEVQEQINELHELLGMSAADVEVVVAAILPSSESDIAIGVKTRQTGNRIRNLLTSFSSSKQNASTTNDTARELVSSPTKWTPFQSSDRYAPIQSSPAVDGEHHSFAEMQQKPRPSSCALPQQSALQWRKYSATDSMPAAQLSRSISIGAASAKKDTIIFPISLDPRRSSSTSSTIASPRESGISMQPAVTDQLRPTAIRRTSDKNRKSPDVQMEAAGFKSEPNDSQQPSRMSLLQPRRAAQQSRKKEGILWAMSKPIAGAGGADAPKSVSRSQNWKECWVVLSGSGHLGQYAEWKDVKVMEPSQPLIDLRFATVREARGVERRFTFEVITRENRRFFQANNEEEMKNWMKAISFAIESLLNGTSSIRQIDKVARVAGGSNDLGCAGDEFGSQGFQPATLGRHKAFSQSLTDLSTASGGGAGKLFHRGGNREEAARKRDSKGINSIASNHLTALSEGGGQYLSDYSSSSSHHQLPWTHHERGISNKTPVSGYVQQLEGEAVESTVMIQSVWTVEPDYDRKIEEMIHSNYGGSKHARNFSLLSSVSPTRQSSQNSQMDAAIAMTLSKSSSTKYTRSKEIVEIAARSENSYCADCRSEDPRWASWCLNGQPRCVFICITCSGHHRGLGVGISRVKSIDLDDWTEEQLNSARDWGNDRVNALYESTKPREVTVATSKGKQFWINKYVDKIWYGEGSAIRVGKEQNLELTPVRRVGATPINKNSAGSPRWPSSPPVVFVSMLEGGNDEATRWKSKSGTSLSSPTTSAHSHLAAFSRASFDDEGPFRHTDSPSFHRFPRQSIEKRIAV